MVDRRRARTGPAARVAHRSRRRRGRLPGRRRAPRDPLQHLLQLHLVRHLRVEDGLRAGAARRPAAGPRAEEVARLPRGARAPRPGAAAALPPGPPGGPGPDPPQGLLVRAALQLPDARHDRPHPRPGAQRRAPARPLRQGAARRRPAAAAGRDLVGEVARVPPRGPPGAGVPLGPGAAPAEVGAPLPPHGPRQEAPGPLEAVRCRAPRRRLGDQPRLGPGQPGELRDHRSR